MGGGGGEGHTSHPAEGLEHDVTVLSVHNKYHRTFVRWHNNDVGVIPWAQTALCFWWFGLPLCPSWFQF